MTFLTVDDVPMVDVLPGLRARRVVDQARGAGAVTLGEMEIDPGVRLPLHRHKVEEVVVIVDGTGRFTADDAAREVATGSVLLAPAGSAHALENTGSVILRILFIFPSVNVERVWVAEPE
ncbi:MAG: cupin domain-containing protein [Candidatus Limnocylindrales bacterium]